MPGLVEVKGELFPIKREKKAPLGNWVESPAIWGIRPQEKSENMSSDRFSL